MKYFKLYNHFLLKLSFTRLLYLTFRIHRLGPFSAFVKERKRSQTLYLLFILSLHLSFNKAVSQSQVATRIQLHTKCGFIIDQDENNIFNFFDSTQFKNFECAVFYKNSYHKYFAILNNSDTVFFHEEDILRFSSQVNLSTYKGNRKDESTSKCYPGIRANKSSKIHSAEKSWEEDTKIRPYLDLSILGIASMLDASFFLMKTSLNTNYNDWNIQLGFSYANSNNNVATYMNYAYDNIYYTGFHFCIGRIFTNDYLSLSTSIGPSMETYTFQNYKNVFFFFGQLEDVYTRKFIGVIFDSQIHFLAHSKLGPVIGLHLSYSEMGFIKGATIGLRLGRILPPYKKY